VHAAQCPNVQRLLFTPEREVEVEWGGEAGSYPVPVHITFEDRPGMLASISQAVAVEEANVRSCHLATQEDRLGTADLVVEARGRRHLEKVLGALRRVPGVITADGSALPPGRRLQLM
jgi:(p)ppGpp synthase/HD superfamily hydrolase